MGKKRCLTIQGGIVGKGGGPLPGSSMTTEMGTWSLGLVMVVMRPVVATLGFRSSSSQVGRLL